MKTCKHLKIYHNPQLLKICSINKGKTCKRTDNCGYEPINVDKEIKNINDDTPF